MTCTLRQSRPPKLSRNSGQGPTLGAPGSLFSAGRKDDAATLKTQLEQLQSELVTERGGRAVDASKALNIGELETKSTVVSG